MNNISELKFLTKPRLLSVHKRYMWVNRKDKENPHYPAHGEWLDNTESASLQLSALNFRRLLLDVLPYFSSFYPIKLSFDKLRLFPGPFKFLYFGAKKVKVKIGEAEETSEKVMEDIAKTQQKNKVSDERIDELVQKEQERRLRQNKSIATEQERRLDPEKSIARDLKKLTKKDLDAFQKNQADEPRAPTQQDKKNSDHTNSSPFDGFEVVLFFPSLLLTNLFVSFNLCIFQLVAVMLNVYQYLKNRRNFKPNSLIVRVIGLITDFIYELHKNQTYLSILLKYIPITLTLFIFILLGNLIGLIPNAFSYTGHIGLTLSVGGILFIAWMIVGMERLGIDFMSLFVPHNCPKWLFPLMLVIEILSYIIRPFSLAIRLFANILSGHILLHLIQETRQAIRDSENSGYITVIPASLSSFVSLSESAVIGLELGVSCLQAYIFVVLSCIYLQENVMEREFGLNLIPQFYQLLKRIYKWINKYILKIDLIIEFSKSKSVAELEQKVKAEIEVILNRMIKEGGGKVKTTLWR